MCVQSHQPLSPLLLFPSRASPPRLYNVPRFARFISSSINQQMKSNNIRSRSNRSNRSRIIHTLSLRRCRTTHVAFTGATPNVIYIRKIIFSLFNKPPLRYCTLLSHTYEICIYCLVSTPLRRARRGQRASVSDPSVSFRWWRPSSM